MSVPPAPRQHSLSARDQQNASYTIIKVSKQFGLHDSSHVFRGGGQPANSDKLAKSRKDPAESIVFDGIDCLSKGRLSLLARNGTGHGSTVWHGTPGQTRGRDQPDLARPGFAGRSGLNNQMPWKKTQGAGRCRLMKRGVA